MTSRYGLAVFGGGSGGLGAAIAAARAGVKTLLVEPHPWLGGTSTTGGVNVWEMGVGGTGLPFDFYARMAKRPEAVGIYSAGRHFCWQPDGWHWPHALDKCCFPGGENVIDPSRRYTDSLRRHPGPGRQTTPEWCRETWHGVPFEPAAFDRAARELLTETGCAEIRTGVRVTGAAATGGRVQHVTLSDGTIVTADAYVDATGDGMLCRYAGCEQHVGLDPAARYGEPGAPEAARAMVNGVTLIYRVARCKTPAVEPLPAGIPETPWWRNAPVPACVNHYPNGDRNINMLPSMDGAEFLTLGYDAAYAECLRRIHYHWHFIQANFPEFRSYRRVWVAPLLGIRESWRTVCEAMLTKNDIRLGLSRQTDTDIIAIADHPLDRHGEGGGCPELEEPYGIPYRCLIPKGFSNLLIACRGAGFSSIAASSCRLSRTMMQLGQAAGTAVALAREYGTTLPEVSPTVLRERLHAAHVQLEWPMPKALREYIETQGAVAPGE